MKKNVILISAALAAVLTASFLYLWLESHKARPRPVVKKRVAAVPAAPKRERAAKVAVVMDDFGYNKNNIGELFAIDQQVTFSILPRLRYSTEIAMSAAARGYEVILHLPLEASVKNVREEADTIRTGMKEDEIITRLVRDISSVPGLRGVSNHMGSRATEDRALMAVIFNYLKEHKLYFFDSLTSEKSVCREVARKVGIPYARRDIFLDNVDDPAAIGKQVLALKRMALKRGKAIAVCHDRRNTIRVLAKMMPELVRDGIKFVPLSEMVR